jgi:autoinducer 2-degrading protein
MFAVTVAVEVAPGRMPDFLPLILENARASLGEPGCLRFDVLTDTARPDEAFLYELYADAAAFDAHLATPHFAAFEAEAGPLMRSKDVRSWASVAG